MKYASWPVQSQAATGEINQMIKENDANIQQAHSLIVFWRSHENRSTFRDRRELILKTVEKRGTGQTYDA